MPQLKYIFASILTAGLMGGHAYVWQQGFGGSDEIETTTVSENHAASGAVIDAMPSDQKTHEPIILRQTAAHLAAERLEVEHAIEQFRKGMVERHPDIIIDYAAPNLTFGHSNGVIQTSEEFAEVVRSGAEIFKRVDLTNRNLVISGDTAVERHHFSADIVYQGKLMNFELEVVEVWKKGPDHWRLLARQAVNAKV